MKKYAALLLAIVLGIVIYCLHMGLDDPFMYFRFYKQRL